MKIFPLILVAAVSVSCGRSIADGSYELHVLSTNDVHGAWFDSTYTGGHIRNSLFAANHYIDSVRAAAGASSVLLIDAGDCLQGDNAAYYYNYVDTLSPHLYPRIARYMKYDAIAVGNHDIETGHKVYDRVAKELHEAGIPFLGANAVRNDNGKSYFPEYTIIEKGGLKVAVLGYGNANIDAWLAEEIWSGMTFGLIRERIQEDVDRIKSKEKPDVMIVVMHSGTGSGDGLSRESEALDAFNSVKGVDFLLCGHDHRPVVITRDSTCLLNSGSHCRYIAHGVLNLEVKDGKIAEKKFSSELIKVGREKADTAMRSAFAPEFKAVKAFSCREIGQLNVPLVIPSAYRGMSDYINLLQTVCLEASGADISMAAPLTYKGSIEAGTLIYNDLFKIYPFENQLYVVRMTGAEIKNYLEKSYDNWINTISSSKDHLLKIRQRDDARTGQKGWSFVNRSYNFDSAGGLFYSVGVTKPFGQRIHISGTAGGELFLPDKEYTVALTSYRANGGGGLLREGAGIDTDRIEERIVARYPEIRELVYQYILKNGSIEKGAIGNTGLIGAWSFVPSALADFVLSKDMELLFPSKK